MILLESNANVRRLTNWQRFDEHMNVETTTANPLDDLYAVLNRELEARFNDLAEEWRMEKKGISSILLMSSLASYRRIMAMGVHALPLILKELQREPDHWFVALRSIAEANGYANPIREEDKGNLRKMCDAWIQWGKEHGYLR